MVQDAFIPYSRSNKKPDWVKHRVIYLKVYLPRHGCRKIAAQFNRQYAHRNVSVSKSYVYEVIKKHRYEILRRRKALKYRVPRALPNNREWNIDLTTVERRQILGIVDSGSRALLTLKHLRTKSTVMILRALLETVEKYGKPEYIKTDNERVFTSRLMKLALWLLGITHRRTQIASPWQNGKIERLFGTMKAAMESLMFPTPEVLEKGLKEFRFYYNHLRPHQHLYGKTPTGASGRLDGTVCDRLCVSAKYVFLGSLEVLEKRWRTA